MNGKRFSETSFRDEATFEELVKKNSKTLFGPKTIYLDLKKQIESKTLGSSIPDGFLFDFAKKDYVDFYLVEVELASHDFYHHIFKQITKFFGFFQNKNSRTDLVENLFSCITSNRDVEEEFRSYLDKKDLHKVLRDILEDSQKILLILDDDKPELEEIFKTYQDTWDKMVTKEIVKEYTTKTDTILFMDPGFGEIALAPASQVEEGRYTEDFHTRNTEEKVVRAYTKLREDIRSYDPEIAVNPQKYYISFRKRRNFAYLTMRRKKLRIIITLPIEQGRSMIKAHSVSEPSQAVQSFYGSPCFEVWVDDDKNLQEIIDAMKEAAKK